MATLDVSFVTICAEFSDSFQVQQRPETISEFGRSSTGGGLHTTAYGTIYPTGDNSLQRQEDKQFGVKTLTVVTPFRLRTASPGAQPDFVLFRGNVYVVREVQDYTQYGTGFVVAIISSVESIDAPPQ